MMQTKHTVTTQTLQDLKCSDEEEMKEMKVKEMMTQFPYQVLSWQRYREEMVWESPHPMDGLPFSG